jgi:hypothetical protein
VSCWYDVWGHQKGLLELSDFFVNSSDILSVECSVYGARSRRKRFGGYDVEGEGHMARGNRSQDRGRARQIVSTAVGAAEVLTTGVVHLTKRTLVEALHAAEDVGSEIGSTLVLAARGSIRAATEIGGDLARVGRGVSRGLGVRPSADGRVRKPLAKARTRRRRRATA